MHETFLFSNNLLNIKKKPPFILEWTITVFKYIHIFSHLIPIHQKCKWGRIGIISVPLLSILIHRLCSCVFWVLHSGHWCLLCPNGWRAGSVWKFRFTIPNPVLSQELWCRSMKGPVPLPQIETMLWCSPARWGWSTHLQGFACDHSFDLFPLPPCTAPSSSWEGASLNKDPETTSQELLLESLT